MAKNDYKLNGRCAGDVPPAVPGIEVEVVRIVSTENRHFFVVGSLPWGKYWHWNGASLKCHQPETCPHCEKAIARKWRSYLHCLEQHGIGQREVIVELTHTATVMLDVLLCGQPHRGSVVNMKKTKGGKHGRFLIEVLPRRIDPATLCDERDVSVVMYKLWEFNERRIGSGEKK